MMIGHYLVSAFARFRNAPFTTAANVLTLALGLASFIAAYGIATYWRSADSYHPDADKLLFISQSINPAGARSPRTMNQTASPTIARYLEADFPELEAVARAIGASDVPFSAGDRKALLGAAYVDPEFLRLFRFDFVEGDASALAEPNGVVLTQDAAQRLFGDEPALGRPVVVDAELNAFVAGVIAPVRQPSFMGEDGFTLRFEALLPWTAGPNGAALDASDSWLNMVGHTVVRLAPTASVEAFRARLPEFLDRRMPPAQQGVAAVFIDAYPVSRMWTLGLQNVVFPGSGGNLSVVAVIVGLGTLTLIVACVNYANLAGAQAIGRVKETGLRKTLGADRRATLSQSLAEALLLSAIAMVAALVVLALVVPAIRAGINVDILYFLRQGPPQLLVLAALVVAVGLAAGAWPAIVLSQVRPAEAMRSGRARPGRARVARVLVGVQFASASFLLLMFTVMQLQRAEIERTAFSDQNGPLVVLNSLAPLGVDYETLESGLLRVPGVSSVTVADYQPWSYDQNVVGLARSADPAGSAPPGYLKRVGHDYFRTLDLEVLAGRVFDRDRELVGTTPEDVLSGRTPPIVIDRKYASRLGFPTPEAAVGEIIYVPQRVGAMTGSGAAPLRVIGVTAPEVSRLEASDVEGHIYMFAPQPTGGAQVPLVRLSGEDVAGAVAGIAGLWDTLAPDVPANIQFAEQLFARSFAMHARISQLFILLTSAAFIISTTGLLGIAVHVVSRRRHEAAVRKTLGSSAVRVVRLFLIEFSKPVLAGNLAAWPLGWAAAQVYLSGFAERIEMTLAPFVASLAVTLAIAWIVVIGEVLKAASVHPAEVLRQA